MLSLGLTLEPGSAGSRTAWVPSALGADLLALWDAEQSSSLSLAGSAVTTWTDVKGGLAPTQSTSGFKPVYSATSFNGRPGITFDGTDDYLRAGSSPLPLNADVSEIWVLASQDVPAGTTGTRSAMSYGSSSGVASRSLKRTVSSGVNRAVALGGNSGGSAISLTDTLLDYSGRHVQRAIFGPTTLGLEGDGLANTPVAMVPLTTAAATTIGSSNASTPVQFWSGVFSVVIVTTGLSADAAAKLLAYLKTRGGIA